MDTQDDPEARIRDLERPLADAARASELGTAHDTGFVRPPPTRPWTDTFPPPPPGPAAPWPGYADHFPAPPPQQHKRSGGGLLMVLGAVIAFMFTAGIAAYIMFAGSTAEGGSAAGETNTRESRAAQPPAALPTVIPPETVTTVVPGEAVIVSGIEEHRTIECDGNAVIVSGIENTVEITGHCPSVTVSGIQNTITVDSADTIGVSGFENRVTFHTGQPQIGNSGMSNTVQQG
ncbi:DUF3060 domain-containing protein [Mycolicibacterium sp. XJ870]